MGLGFDITVQFNYQHSDVKGSLKNTCVLYNSRVIVFFVCVSFLEIYPHTEFSLSKSGCGIKGRTGWLVSCNLKGSFIGEVAKVKSVANKNV